MTSVPFLNRKRLTTYPILFLSISVLAFSFTVAFGSGLVDAFGHAVGPDFLGYWAAGKAAAAGTASEAYDVRIHQQMSEAVVGASIPKTPWLYPPTFLLLILPLAKLSYLHALVLWTFLSIVAYVAVMRWLLPEDRAAWLPALAFPAFVMNLLEGSNGCLTLALLGSGLLLLRRRPSLAGMCLGLLSYKPQLLPLAWVALLAGRRWRTLVVALLAATGFSLLSVEVLGLESWRAFFGTARYAVDLLESGAAPLAKMSTMQSAMLLLGAPLPVARGAQATVSLITVVAVWISWRRETPPEFKSSVLLLATLLATPYGAYAYDLVLLAPVIAWLALAGMERGWRPGEKAALVTAWLLPLLGPWMALRTRIAAGPFILIFLLALALARVRVAGPICGHRPA